MSEGYIIEKGPITIVPDPMNPNFFQIRRNPMWGVVAQIVPFADILRWNYAEEFERAIRYAVSRHMVALDERSEYFFDRIGRIDLDSAAIERVYLRVINNDEYRIYTVVHAGYTVHLLNGKTDCGEQDYCIQGTYSTIGRSNFFEKIDKYNYDAIPKNKPLDEYMVRCLGRNDLDEIVEEMLHRYWPEVLEKPMRVDMKELAHRMGYPLINVRLSLNNTKLGSIIFEDTEITYYKDGIEKRGVAPKNSILIDTQAHRILKKRTSDTIAHELSHGYVDYGFYHSQSMYRSMLGLAALELEEMILCENGDDPLHWVEDHAIHIAPRLRMPLRQFGMKVAELIEKYKHLPETLMYEQVIEELSVFYDVSKEAVRIRLVETGHDKVRGIGEFANGEPVPGYLVEKDIPDNQTYTLDFDKVVAEAERNAAFRKLLYSGIYIYVEGHLCRNDDRYIWEINGEPCLSPLARTHMRECCLLFTIRHEGQDCEYVSGTLNCTATKRGELSYLYTAQCESNEEQTEYIAEILADIPDTFGDTMKYHMHNLDLTKEKLGEMSFLSTKTIMRMRNAKKKMPSLESIVAASIGMHLYPALSEDLLDKADRHFDPEKPAHKWYKAGLTTMYRSDMNAFNKLMEKHSIPPLKDDPDDADTDSYAMAQ